MKKYEFTRIATDSGAQTVTQTTHSIAGSTDVGSTAIVIADGELYIGGSSKQTSGTDAWKERPVMIKYALDRADTTKTDTDWTYQLSTSTLSSGKYYSVDVLSQQTYHKSIVGVSNAYEVTGEQVTGPRALLVYLIKTMTSLYFDPSCTAQISVLAMILNVVGQFL